MAVSVRASTKAASASATSISVSAPTGTAANDRVVVQVGANNVVTLSDNNGATSFTKDNEQSEAVNGATMAVFSRLIQSGDPASYSFNSSGAASRISAVAVTFMGEDTTTAYDVAPTAGTGNIASGPVSPYDLTALTITTITDLAIHCAVFAGDSSSFSIDAVPAGYTEHQRVTASGQRLSFCTKVITPAGATGAQTFSMDSQAGMITQSFAVKNAAAGGTTTNTGWYSSKGGWQ